MSNQISVSKDIKRETYVCFPIKCMTKTTVKNQILDMAKVSVLELKANPACLKNHMDMPYAAIPSGKHVCVMYTPLNPTFM